MGAETQRRPGRGAAAVCSLAKTSNTENSTPAQIFNIDGERLPSRRHRVYGAPRLASPSWYRLAADRWVEVQP